MCYPEDDAAEAALLQEQNDEKSQSCLSFTCMWIMTVLFIFLVIITFPISAWFVLKKVPNKERFVVFRLGRIIGSKGPGVILLLPFIDQWQVVDIRSKIFTVALFEASCKDRAQIIVGAEVSCHVSDPEVFVTAVEDIWHALERTAKSVMINLLLKKSLAKIKKNKSKFEQRLSSGINQKTKSWGVRVDRVTMVIHSEDLHLSSATTSSRVHHDARSSSSSVTSLQQPSTPSTDSEEMGKGAGYEDTEDDRFSPDWVLTKVQSLLTEDLVKQIGAVYLFVVSLKDGNRNLYHLDLTRDSGYAGYGLPKIEPDVTMEVTEKTMRALLTGSTRPFSAYMSGKIRLQGDLKTAMKLEDLIKLLPP
ncbi:stomatin-like protein 1 [Amblyraja radiata]|uniref:stomatin-like protein 1 n=1 Tax=Amblyraja radiata TaxID=386614 RepID=UPI001403CE83|nr:stomatin-like protein 1 [Amblyraja radiata]